MSRPAVVLLEGAQAWVLTVRGTMARVPLPLANDRDTGLPADAVTDALRAALAPDGRDPRTLIVVVGGAWLDCAQPTLPPLRAGDRRRALHHQADRFFALPGPVASTVYDDVAIACDAGWLTPIRTRLEAWTEVRAVLALPEAAVTQGIRGAWDAEATPAGAGTVATLEFTLGAGGVSAARVVRGAAGEASSRALAPEALLRAVQGASARGWPAERQLLDVATEDRLRQARRRAWWRAGALLAAAAVLLGWAAGARRERLLVAAERAQQTAATDAAPALAAQERLQRAAREGALLRTAAAAATHAGAPSRVLATLGAQLPATAFVQHLEWDGQQWRIDGSAVDAAALVPRLDAVPDFEQVRSLAPSTRFLDGGTARSSFSIGFQVKGAPAAPGARDGAR